MKPGIVYWFIGLLIFSSCTVNRQIAKTANKELLSDSALLPAYVGVSVYEPATGKYWYQHDARKYFVPASNTKLFTLYAGMKYLGDSLPGLKYYETADTLFIQPTGDPSLLHPDFNVQRVADFLKNKNKPIVINDGNWRDEALGYGWAWDDYNGYYMAERSPMPVYGNTIRWSQTITGNKQLIIKSTPFLNWESETVTDSSNKRFNVRRERDENLFHIYSGSEKYSEQEIPYVTKGIETARLFLADSLKLNITSKQSTVNNQLSTLYSIPSDSLYKPMMHRSDNFFAEQTLLMAANKKLGLMNDEAIINYLLKNELKDIPQKPKWVDGSGLSRYNLFTPQSFVWILNKMKEEFGLERMKNILATGGEGTLRSLFLNDKGFVFAKTGTLSNHTSMSGYVITKKNKLLIFSLQANHFLTGATPVRLAFERFISQLRNNY
ncbi:MAG: D-alanyl-D-alanine carboxypeptidase/D-alanyl-D-alanine-endopeptidase [Sphingobacteriales bacterium]